MKACAVPLCSNTSNNRPDLTFFCLPKTRNIREEWLEAVGVKSRLYLQYVKVCEVHFRSKDFVAGKKQLKFHAVPLLKLGPGKTDPVDSDDEFMQMGSESDSEIIQIDSPKPLLGTDSKRSSSTEAESEGKGRKKQKVVPLLIMPKHQSAAFDTIYESSPFSTDYIQILETTNPEIYKRHLAIETEGNDGVTEELSVEQKEVERLKMLHCVEELCESANQKKSRTPMLKKINAKSKAECHEYCQEPQTISPPVEVVSGRRPTRRAAQVAAKKIHNTAHNIPIKPDEPAYTPTGPRFFHTGRRGRPRVNKRWLKKDVDLVMECGEEILSEVQAEAMLKAQLEYNQVMKRLRMLKADNVRIIEVDAHDSPFVMLPSSVAQRGVKPNVIGLVALSPDKPNVVPILLSCVAPQTVI